MMYIKFCGVEIIEVIFIALSRTLGICWPHVVSFDDSSVVFNLVHLHERQVFSE